MRPVLTALIPFSVFGAFYSYILIRLFSGLSVAWPAFTVGLALLLSASVSALHITAFGFRFSGKSGPLLDRMSWLSYLTLSFAATLFVLSLLRDAAWLLASVASAVSPPALSSPSAPSTAWSTWWFRVNLAVLGLSFAATVLGFIEARRRPRIRRVDVAIKDLPASLQGFSIAQLSDIHVGPTIKRRFVESIVNATNSLGADVIAITGDLVDGSVEDLADQVAPLASLVASHGTYFVTGNHEYYAGAEAWIEHVRSLGIDVLMNEHRVLDVDDAQLTLAGITDFSAGKIIPEHASDPAAALAAAPDGVRILLAHQPRSALQLVGLNVDLMLAGHTHGGQFWPWHLFVPLQQPMLQGLARIAQTLVFTSRGTGYWGPPNRLGAPSEITLLRLIPASR